VNTRHPTAVRPPSAFVQAHLTTSHQSGRVQGRVEPTAACIYLLQARRDILSAGQWRGVQDRRAGAGGRERWLRLWIGQGQEESAMTMKGSGQPPAVPQRVCVAGARDVVVLLVDSTITKLCA
jgi:hypothetical protein